MASEKWKKENVEKLRKYRRDWYNKNKQKQLERQEKRKKEIRVWFNKYKQSLKCEYCGENDSCCLDFHHNNPNKKEKAVSVLVGTYSKARILKEIEKCAVLCANCHRKLHAGRLIGRSAVSKTVSY
jgi:transcription elongation factor Elf1